MKEKIIIGAGRHAAETYYLLEDLGLHEDIIAFATDDASPGQEFMGVKVWTISEILKTYGERQDKPSVIIAVGATEPNKRLALVFRKASFPFFNAISPNIALMRQQSIGEGVTIAQGVVLTCNVSVGNHVIINIGCTISHDCVLGDHVNLSPGCHLAGNVHIEEDVFVGTGVVFIPKVRVGRGSVIAAGACVTKDVPPNVMVAGVPATIKKQLR